MNRLDGAGDSVGCIPPVYMVDASHDPANRGGARSDAVTYRLLQDGGGWALGMVLDRAWLDSPARVDPVIADPGVRFGVWDDTFVYSAVTADFSAADVMYAGTSDGGRSQLAAYVRFSTAEASLGRRYILGAALGVYTEQSSCTTRPLTVYRVTQDWSSGQALSWPGPGYDASSPIGTATFARRTNCGDAPGWDTIPIDPARLQDLENKAQWHGFTLRASSSDNNGYKRLGTAEGAAAPFLDVLFSDEGADIRLDSGRISPPVTPSTSGFLLVWATNLGLTNWTPTNGFKLVAITTNAAGIEVKRSTVAESSYPVVYYGWGSWFWVELGPVPAGTYTLRLTMQDASGRLFDDL